jgi:hypothetical protein
MNGKFFTALCEREKFISPILPIPTDGVSTLSWWWGLSALETLRAVLTVA